MNEIKFASDTATILEKRTLLRHLEQSAIELFKRLDDSWNSLGSGTTDLERAQQMLGYNNNGAQIYNKFFTSGLEYKDRAPDTLSKMLGMFKPCCATYIDTQRKKICLSFNDTLIEPRQIVIIEK